MSAHVPCKGFRAKIDLQILHYTSVVGCIDIQKVMKTMLWLHSILMCSYVLPDYENVSLLYIIVCVRPDLICLNSYLILVPVEPFYLVVIFNYFD